MALFFYSVVSLFPKWDKVWKSATENREKNPNIAWPLLVAFGPAFLVGGLYQLAYVLLQFVSPQILNLLIAFVGSNEPSWHGYLFVVILSIVALVTAAFDSQYWYKQTMVGLRLRTCLSSAIYRKSMKLSSNARKGYTGVFINCCYLTNI